MVDTGHHQKAADRHAALLFEIISQFGSADIKMLCQSIEGYFFSEMFLHVLHNDVDVRIGGDGFGMSVTVQVAVLCHQQQCTGQQLVFWERSGGFLVLLKQVEQGFHDPVHPLKIQWRDGADHAVVAQFLQLRQHFLR